MRRSSLAMLAALLLPAAVRPQRETALRQIRVPHNYYYREMYLPQVTSGASAVTWSPDGQEVIYSMQGALWRQRVGSDEASLLADGPGYDHQPDWSPDGRFVAYVSYEKDAMPLRLLDLTSGESRVLLENGAVNVEPRWSPDGAQLAFVSTAYEGRFHVFVAPFTGGALGAPQRISQDRNSALPRYYYSVYDHYLSPTWSPDGRELIVVSNRGHIWGSGGVWRMDARAAGELREIRTEETTWRARPDWSRDGKRVVYASYLGRQWHQLWLMTSDGSNPFQLTYGEFDATGPRWSPDGERIAYISNQGGNTSLRIVTVPGAAVGEVRAQRRRYLRPHGTLSLTIADATAGVALIPARVSVTGADGRGYAPDDAWRHADDGFDRRERSYEPTYFHTAGTAGLTLPAGQYTVEVSRGLEYRLERRSVSIAPNAHAMLRVALRRSDNLAARGWYNGDLHIHMNYGGSYRNTPERLRAQARAEALDVVENLIVNKEGRIPDIAYFGTDRGTQQRPLILHDEEYHTSHWGHTGLLGLTSHVVLPGYAAYTNTAASSLVPMNSDIFALARAQGGVVGYVHPFDVFPDPTDRTRALNHEIPVTAALSGIDYYESVGFNEDAMATQRVWYALLNNGFRIAAGGGTDAMMNYASLRGPLGVNRVYVQVPGPLTQRSFLAGLKAGRTFATNSALLELSVNARGIGSEIALPNGRHALNVRARMRSLIPLQFVEIIRNGEVAATVPLSADSMSASADITIDVDKSAWILLRAWSKGARHPIFDYAPMATTSPIYVTVGGAPVRSRQDAEYFIAWIDRLIEGAETHQEYNTPAEKERVLARLAQARAEYIRRAVQP
ncbi:MAG: CehA/McbA family metallohydrolase [Gemmatimonadaceae bacterium]